MCFLSLSLSLSLSVCLSRSNPAVSFRLVFHPIQSPRPPRLQLDPVVFHSDVILRHPIRNSRILSNPIRSDSVPFSRGEEARRRIADCGLRVAGCGLQVAGLQARRGAAPFAYSTRGSRHGICILLAIDWGLIIPSRLGPASKQPIIWLIANFT